nr:hypothetical protein [Tanacetum cinerariifolium]
MFEKAFKRVNTFEDFRTELVEGKEKRVGTEQEQEITKKQKVKDHKENPELKQLMETIPDEKEVAINAISLAVKTDLKDLYKLVKARYRSTRPMESMDYLLWSEMKIIIKPHVEDEVWKMQQGYKVLEWKLYDSYRVHSLMMQSMQIYMLVEKKLQNLVSQFELLGEKLSQEDVNQKLLKSLSPEWNTHVVVGRNKEDMDTMSMDDLYNNLKVYDPEIKRMSSLNSNTQNMACLSSTNKSTNGGVNTAQAVNTANGVSTIRTQVNAAFSTNIDNLSDAVICTFLDSQPNSPSLAHEDLEQIHPDDIKEMDLRWKITILAMRAKRFLKKTRRKLTVSGNETFSFDMSKVEYYNCHKRGHFARECKALRNQDNKHKESTKRSVPVETHASTALVPCDGLGEYDWSDQVEEGPNYALMAYTSSCSDSKKSELMVLDYKTGLKSVGERLKFFKKNEFIYLEDIKVLKVEIQMKKIAIKEFRRKLEVAQKEKDGIQLTVEKLENVSKNINKLIDCQIVDNCKKGLGYESYNAVPPPYTGNFMPLKPNGIC